MKAIPEASIDSKVLYDRLSKTEKGDIISYKELSELIDRDIQREGRGFLYTAMRMVLRDNGLVFEAVTNIGMKCLTDEENAMTTGECAIGKIRRVSSKSIKKIISIDDFNLLSNVAKIKHNMSLSILGVFKNITQPKKMKGLENKFGKTKRKLAVNKTLELFKQ